MDNQMNGAGSTRKRMNVMLALFALLLIVRVIGAV